MLQIVKVKKSFIIEYKKHTTNDQLLESEVGRPCVLKLKLKYKGKKHLFVVPLRSNISKGTPSNQYFALPPTSKTKPGNHHGISYVKIFPIKKEYIDNFLITTGSHMEIVKKRINDNEKTIVDACQDYLYNYEKGIRSPYSPDIDSILQWLYN